MKKAIVVLATLVLLVMLSVTVATAGEGDPQPGVEYNPYGVYCGIDAGEYGWFSTMDWWWAVYSNDVGIFKCVTQLHPEQVPPATTMVVWEGWCGTPGGSTDNSRAKVFPDGRVVLTCKVK